HTRLQGDWSSDVCSSDLHHVVSRSYSSRRGKLVCALQRNGAFLKRNARRKRDLMRRTCRQRSATPRLRSRGRVATRSVMPVRWRSEERRVGKEGGGRWGE